MANSFFSLHPIRFVWQCSRDVVFIAVEYTAYAYFIDISLSANYCKTPAEMRTNKNKIKINAIYVSVYFHCSLTNAWFAPWKMLCGDSNSTAIFNILLNLSIVVLAHKYFVFYFSLHHLFSCCIVVAVVVDVFLFFFSFQSINVINLNITVETAFSMCGMSRTPWMLRRHRHTHVKQIVVVVVIVVAVVAAAAVVASTFDFCGPFDSIAMSVLYEKKMNIFS